MCFLGPTWKVLACTCSFMVKSSASGPADLFPLLFLSITETCGTSTPYMQAAFPSKTFPNHYTIVTVTQRNSCTQAGNQSVVPVCTLHIHVWLSSVQSFDNLQMESKMINCCYERIVAPVLETVDRTRQTANKVDCDSFFITSCLWTSETCHENLRLLQASMFPRANALWCF